MIEEHLCANWNEFKLVLRDKIWKNGVYRESDFLYRGHSNPGYKLQSSFDRWYKGKKERRTMVADQLLDSFKRECEGDLDIPREVIQDEDRLRALAQHHGLPTRLLDWTVSPYVAAFFAFSYTFAEDLLLEDRVAIWVLDPNSEIWTQDNGAYIVDPQRFGNERLRMQGGYFTHLIAAFDSLEDYVDSFGATHALEKIVLQTADIEYALSDLKAMQIKHSRLFPGEQGYAMEAKTKVGLDQRLQRI